MLQSVRSREEKVSANATRITEGKSLSKKECRCTKKCCKGDLGARTEAPAFGRKRKEKQRKKNPVGKTDEKKTPSWSEFFRERTTDLKKKRGGEILVGRVGKEETQQARPNGPEGGEKCFPFKREMLPKNRKR